jgi:hypothetical protein
MSVPIVLLEVQAKDIFGRIPVMVMVAVEPPNPVLQFVAEEDLQTLALMVVHLAHQIPEAGAASHLPAEELAEVEDQEY